jgi:regulatory protein
MVTTMKITKIERQKKNPNRFSISIDGQFSFGIENIDIVNYNLSEDMILTEELYNDIYKNALFGKAKNRACNYLGYKCRTKKEIIVKLKDDFNLDIIEEVLLFLEKYNYIDDYKYCIAFISEKMRLKGYGKIRLKYELKNKGVDDDVINKAIDELDIDELSVAIKLINKKTNGNINLDIKEKNKIYGFLTRRGFGVGTITEAFKYITE